MAGYTAGDRISAEYYASVYKPALAGWRSERVRAVLEVISPGKARVISAEMEQAGARRQEYNVRRAEAEQVGAVKIISRLTGVKLVSAADAGAERECAL